MPFVAMDRVSVDSNRYGVKQQKVTELIETTEIDRRLNPIILNWQMNLIVGLHRSIACKMLGLKQIEYKSAIGEAAQTAQLSKIDENLLNQLNAITRAEDWQECISEQIKSETLSEKYVEHPR